MTADATVVDDEKGRPTTDDVAAAAAEPRRNRKGAAERQRSMRRRRRRRKEAGELLPRIRVRGFASARSSRDEVVQPCLPRRFVCELVAWQ